MKKITLFISVLLFTLSIKAQCNEPSNVYVETETFSIPPFITWTENGTATTWDVEYDFAGFSPTGIPLVEDLTDTTFDISALDIVLYDFYVRADCGTEQSAWVGPFTFYNHCMEYGGAIEGFDDVFLPLCWAQANQGSPNSEPSGFGQGSWEQSYFANGSSNLSAKMHIHGIEVNDWLITPLLMAMIPIKEETFWIYYSYTIALTQHNSTDMANLGSDDIVQLVYSLDYGKTWQNIQTWDSSSTISNTGESFSDYVEVNTDSYWLLVAFWVSSGIVNDIEDIDFFIDNVGFDYQGTGNVDELASKGFSYFPNPSTNTINICAKEPINQVVLYNNLGQKLKEVSINALNKQIAISDLPNGIYFMEVRIGDTIGTVSVIKN